MATYTKKASDLAIGDYLVHVSATVDNSEVTYSEPYPQVTGISWGTFIDQQGGVNYGLNGGSINYNMLHSAVITVSTGSSNDGKTIAAIPADRLLVGDSLNGVAITDVKIVATTSDSVQHNYLFTDVVSVAR